MALERHDSSEPVNVGSGVEISIRELAERNSVPKAFLEHIMLELKGQGWVSSLPGKRGGYVLAKRPEEITLAGR